MNAEKYRAYASQLVRNPDDPVALVNQFSVISEKKEYAGLYLPLAKRAYELAPDEINALFNYGSALQRAGEFGKALEIYKRCEKIATSDWCAKIQHHIGVSYRALGEDRKAAEHYMRSYELEPNPNTLKDRALAILAQGKLREGLEAFECRKEAAVWKLHERGGHLIAQAKLPEGVVQWSGEDLTGKTVVVYHEEGSGDFIQFCRFIPKLREYGARYVYLCGPVDNLLDLVRDNIGIDGLVPLSGPFECDFVVGSMSIPWRCGVELDQVNGRPYFKAEAAKIPRRGALNVGLVWRGNAAYGNDVHRSMAFENFCPLFDLPGVAFYSLQAGAPGLEVTGLGFDGFVANLEPLAQTWRDTARLIQALDVVVSVDTAVAHLSGALGKPVFTLVTNASDWRWNRNSQKTVWYDSMRVIRQKKQGDWWPCIKTVREELKGMVNVRRQAA
jgi:hypothetical protein